LRDPISKIARAKWTGGAAQAVEPLLLEHEALRSHTHTKKMQKTKKLLNEERL
jgi:hypothetical protein